MLIGHRHNHACFRFLNSQFKKWKYIPFVDSEVVDKGGVEPLIALLNDEKPLVQANAAVCLTNLATEGMYALAVKRDLGK